RGNGPDGHRTCGLWEDQNMDRWCPAWFCFVNYAEAANLSQLFTTQEEAVTGKT
ncbi:hypothetical protein CRUP_022264, partial [Coryphaenoides rupestris]